MNAALPTKPETTTQSDPDAGFSAELPGLMPRLRQWAKRLYRDDESAADLVQETLAKAWQSRRSFVRGTNLEAWLVTIMRNQFRSEFRRAWRKAAWNQEAAEQIPGARDEQIWNAELADVTRALGSLSKRQREALILTDIGGFSSEEAAALSHCRPTAIKSRASRARHSLAAMLKGEEPISHHARPAPGRAADEIISQLEFLTAGAAPRSRMPQRIGAPALA
ncbi:MAG TPA: sigma-70 family RNA polymerase sigma factor [Rhizomicrobium sp.]|jgi:RNA polymerase sigma-70 factor (ECF subfamily)|nr:sigma-70 family RNA polymerase sigma factor [Rhizomicrobium sp.]